MFISNLFFCHCEQPTGLWWGAAWQSRPLHSERDEIAAALASTFAGPRNDIRVIQVFRAKLLRQNGNPKTILYIRN